MKRLVLVGFGVLILGVAIGYLAQYPIFVPRQDEKGVAAPVYRTSSPGVSFAPLVAVVIDNSPEARPSSGLGQADVVMETLTESGITRYLAFFQSREVSRLGPVRSARPYFLDWAAGFGAVIAHSGGSDEALSRIREKTRTFKDIDEFYSGNYFWRDGSREAPYNLYTSTKLLEELIAKKDLSAVSVFGWQTKAEGPSATTTFKELVVDFSYPTFLTTYRYDPRTNSYHRSLAGKPHHDTLTNQQIAVKNVVVLYTTSSTLDEKLLTINLQTLGSGRAIIFRDGQIIRARWQKLGEESLLKLIDADGTEIALNKGSTWIAVVDQFGRVSWK